jgi:predicted metalloprotease with PDZ domain
MLIDGEKVTTNDGLIQGLRNKRMGTEVKIRVMRGDQQMDVQATLAPFERVYGQTRRMGFRGLETGEPTGADKAAWLGVHLDETSEMEGAMVAAVYPSGPAARAGIRDGDVITRFGEHQIKSAQDLSDIVEKSEPNSEVEFTIMRGQTERKLTAQLGSRMMFAETQGRTYAREGEQNQQQNEQEHRFDHDEMLENVPEHALLVEQNRQLCVQNERVERLLLQLMQDVRALRDEVAALKNGGAEQPAVVPEQPENTATPPQTEPPAPQVE